ncbi:hypothetical protein HDU98_004804, partial [Podochytrium sp. JEL0797]
MSHAVAPHSFPAIESLHVSQESKPRDLAHPTHILDIPPEIVFALTSTYLTFTDLISLLQTCRSIHTCLNASPSLWAAMSFKRHGVNYIESGGDWRTTCLSRNKACPHLSPLSDDRVAKDRVSVYERLMSNEAVQCIIPECDFGIPDLWLCLSPHCASLSCGRTKNKHAVLHNETHPTHSISLKVNTLEMWCYACKKWLGQQGLSPVAECERVNTLAETFTHSTSPQIHTLQHLSQYNSQRHTERELFRIEPHAAVRFVSAEFWGRWNLFLMGDEGPPGEIDNRALVLPQGLWREVGCPEGLRG